MLEDKIIRVLQDDDNDDDFALEYLLFWWNF